MAGAANLPAESALAALLEMRNATFLAQESVEKLCQDHMPFGLLESATRQSACFQHAAQLQRSGDVTRMPLPKTSVSCAVVGSGPGIAGSGAGDFIK